MLGNVNVQPMREQLLRYLFGEAGETEQQEVEARYFSDPQYLQELWAVFDELTDDYLSGELSGKQKFLFERRLQNSPALRERVEASRALLHWIAENETPAPAQTTPARTPAASPQIQARPPFFSRLKISWGNFGVWQRVLFVVLLLSLVCCFVFSRHHH